MFISFIKFTEYRELLIGDQSSCILLHCLELAKLPLACWVSGPRIAEHWSWGLERTPVTVKPRDCPCPGVGGWTVTAQVIFNDFSTMNCAPVQEYFLLHFICVLCLFLGCLVLQQQRNGAWHKSSWTLRVAGDGGCQLLSLAAWWHPRESQAPYWQSWFSRDQYFIHKSSRNPGHFSRCRSEMFSLSLWFDKLDKLDFSLKLPA